MPVTSNLEDKDGLNPAPKVNHLALLTGFDGDKPQVMGIPPGATLFFFLPEDGGEAKMMQMILRKVARTYLDFQLGVGGPTYRFAVTGTREKELKMRGKRGR